MSDSSNKYCDGGCGKRSRTYGYKMGGEGLYCADCGRKRGLINVKTGKKQSIICIEGWCTIRATYNYSDEKKGIYCAQHKIEGMVDIRSRRCKHEGCTKQPGFNYEGQKKALYCAQHKIEGMVDIRSKRCKHEGCTKQPNFNYEGQKKALYCNRHKLQGMVDVKNRRCRYEGCSKQPGFNYEGQKNALYCDNHKLEGMVDVRHTRCRYEGCIIRPSFNYEKQKIGLYCNLHKLKGMVDVSHRRCKHESCTKVPTFNYKGQKDGLYCDRHKLESMINVRNKTCIYGDGICNERAYYALSNSQHLIYCREHAPPDAILRYNKCRYCEKYGKYYIVSSDNTRVYYCVKHKPEDAIVPNPKTCIVNNCTSRPCYSSTSEGKVEYCSRHRPTDYYYSKGSRCQYTDCREKADYAPLHIVRSIHCRDHRQENEYGRWKRFPRCEHCSNPAYYSTVSTEFPSKCSDHADPDDVNLVEKQCKSCSLLYIMYSNQDECYYCKPSNKPRESRRLVHQERVRNVLEDRGIEYDSYDMMIEKGTYRYRPDFIMDRGTYNLYLEVDEKQHKSYDRDCEIVRMYNIHSEYLNVPSIFIRYSPDSWTDSEGIYHDEGSIEQLLYVLNSVLDIIDPIPQSLSVIYVCYDGGPVQRYKYCDIKQSLVQDSVLYSDSLVQQLSKLSI